MKSKESSENTYQSLFYYLEHDDITLYAHRYYLGGYGYATVKSFKSVGEGEDRHYEFSILFPIRCEPVKVTVKDHRVAKYIIDSFIGNRPFFINHAFLNQIKKGNINE